MNNMKKQSGFVSIITVITLSILLTLITLAFVKVMSSGQRQTLDSQLSTQAYYAAETGVNDALKAILNNPTAIKNLDTDCNATPFTPTGPIPSGQITNGTTTVSYSCQLITSGTKDILMTAVDGVAKTFPIYTDGAASSISIEWEDVAANSNFNTGASDTYPRNWSNTAPAMLRITVYAPGGGSSGDGNVSGTDLLNNQRNFFIKPGVSTNSGEISYSDPDGTTALANCSNISNVTPARPYACRITIKDIATTQIKNGVFLKVQPIYRDTKYRITASPSNSYNTADALPLFGAQYRIDVTGRANDVFRRIEVRLPLAGFVTPDGGVDSRSICKNFEWTGSGIVPGSPNPCNY